MVRKVFIGLQFSLYPSVTYRNEVMKLFVTNCLSSIETVSLAIEISFAILEFLKIRIDSWPNKNSIIME